MTPGTHALVCMVSQGTPLVLICAPDDTWLAECRKQQAASSRIHRQAMEETEEARRMYIAACTESKKIYSQRK